MAWYRAGTVTVTNGSAAVTGANTDFVANTQQGEAFLGPDGRVYEVDQVVSATQIVLGMNYQGGSAGAQGYALMPTSSFARDLALGAAQLLNTFAAVRDGVGAGMFPDGSAAAPGFRFAADQDTGLRRTGENSQAVTCGGVDRLIVDPSGARVMAPGSDGFSIRGAGARGGGNIFGSIYDATGRKAYWGYGTNDDTFFLMNEMIAPLVLGVSGVEKARLDPAGNFGVGTNSPLSKGHFSAGNATQVTIENTSGGGDNGVVFKVPGKQWNFGINIGGTGAGSLNFYDVNRGTSVMNLDTAGNLLVGVSSAANHTIARGGSEGDLVLNVSGLASGSTQFYSVSGTGPSGAAAAIKAGASSVTGRTMSAGGTINASGADYAEYMTKAPGCGHVSKGDVCGVDSQGRITRSWAEAVLFKLKSTDPNLVGGDTWAAHLGARPVEPALMRPQYAGPSEPQEPVVPAKPSLVAEPAPIEPVRVEGEEDIDTVRRMAAYLVASSSWIAGMTAYQEASKAYAVALPAYEAAMVDYARDRSAYDAAQEAYAAEVAAAESAHDAALAQYDADLATFEAELEVARQTVDRIAYCGRVPVNFAGACQPGDYLVAIANGGGIGLKAVAEADITFADYRHRVGRVLLIGEDSRPIVDVMQG